MASNKLAAAAGLVLTCCATARADYRFQAPDVLDLDTSDHLLPLAKSDPLVPGPLAADAAKTIIAAPELGNDAPGQLPMLDGSDKAARKSEAARIAAEAAAVQRTGKTLTIKTSGAAVVFTDRPPPKRSDVEADGELFVYAGRIGAAKYHRVEERFEQDAPGSYLVSPGGGKSVFVPNGSYVEQLSPDGRWLLSAGGGTRALLVLMSLAADGPALALICEGGDTPYAGPSAFKGWRDAKTFDLVLNPLVVIPGKPGDGAASTAPPVPIPLRFRYDGQRWLPQTPDAKALQRVGYVCRE